jgi:hypothetical protein
MTVGAQKPNVSQPVVVPPAVDVIELERDRAIIPRVSAADLAPAFLETGPNKPVLQRMCLD